MESIKYALYTRCAAANQSQIKEQEQFIRKLVEQEYSWFPIS
jgi:hypothetical protein